MKHYWAYKAKPKPSTSFSLFIFQMVEPTLANGANVEYLEEDFIERSQIQGLDYKTVLAEILNNPSCLRYACVIILLVKQLLLCDIGKQYFFNFPYSGTDYPRLARRTDLLTTCQNVRSTWTQTFLISTFYCSILTIYRSMNQVLVELPRPQLSVEITLKARESFFKVFFTC